MKRTKWPVPSSIRKKAKKPIVRTKRRIQSVIPKSFKVEIAVRPTILGKFKTKIVVAVPNNLLIATKISDSYLESIEKAEKAIIKQSNKIKTKKLRRFSLKKVFGEEDQGLESDHQSVFSGHLI